MSKNAIVKQILHTISNKTYKKYKLKNYKNIKINILLQVISVYKQLKCWNPQNG